ncbi:MAG: hypothetical protein ACJ716_05925 [Marmoricola sp.]
MTHLVGLVVLLAGVTLTQSALLSAADGQEQVPLSGIVIAAATGDLNDDLSLDTAWSCRPDDTFVGVELYGQGLTTTNSLLAPVAYNQTNAPPDSIGGFHLDVPTTLAQLFAANGVENPTGDYVFGVSCGTDPDHLDFWGGKRLRFTSGASGKTYEQIEPVKPLVTVTPSFESPVLYDPLHGSRFTVSLDPSDAQGVIDFHLDGGFVPGNIFTPAAVQEHWFTLTPGTHSVVADFTQTYWYAYRSASSQPATVVVAGPAAVKGTARFGSVLTCSSVSGATRTFAWILDGSTQSSVTTSSVKVPRAWVGHSVACRVKTSDADSSVTVSSPGQRVRLAVAPVAQIAPSISGTARQGQRLTCSPGRWSPSPSYFTYRWRRNGVLLPGSYDRRRLVSDGDVGNLLSCVVGAHLAGHEVGRATSHARRAWG